MNPEIAAMKGERADAKHRFSDFDVEAKGLVLLIRMQLNPHEEDTTKLNTRQALISLKRLDQIRSEMTDLKAKIEQIEDYFK